MSAKVREQAERLRQKFARRFKVELTSVQVREFVNASGQDDAEVFVPGADLPRWSVGAP